MRIWTLRLFVFVLATGGLLATGPLADLPFAAWSLDRVWAEDPPVAPPAEPGKTAPFVPPAGPAMPPRGASREAMWAAPTAADWAKPVLLTFQRTWDDAVALSKETRRPLLVCINMDGEIASEHYAGVRYRQPEIAELYAPYIKVIASVYRHTPRDYDDEGRRILCPRFGSVTCGEHIGIEPLIFEKFCDGQRVAPRHIAVDLEGKETYDVYYANDTASVFQTIAEGLVLPADVPRVETRGDRPLLDRVAGRDVRDRDAVEAAFAEGGSDLQRALLERARAQPEVAHLDLLRIAIFGLDPDLAREARAALARSNSPAAVSLLAEALRVPMAAEERDALIAALERLGETTPLARWLAVAHRGLSSAAEAVDAAAWAEAADPSAPVPSVAGEGESLTSYGEGAARRAKVEPTDPAAQLAMAEAALHLALEARERFAARPGFARRFERAMHVEALEAAEKAVELGGAGWRFDGVHALALYYAGRAEDAYPHAEQAVRDLPPGDPSWASMALVTVFAEGRWKQIKQAVAEKRNFSPHWLADLHAACSILLKHPLGTDERAAWHYDLLSWLGADGRAQRVLHAALDRWPASPRLHAALRTRLLERQNADALEKAYADLLAERGESAPILWFAVEASRTAAENHRRERRGMGALAAYDRALALLERTAATGAYESEPLDTVAALLLAGRASLRMESGDLAGARADILASFARDVDAAGTRDGMGITPGETAKMLLDRLRSAGDSEAVAQLEAVLATIDPELLRPDREG